MILLLAVACAPEEDPDVLREGDTGAVDTGAPDTDTDDTDSDDTDYTDDTDTGGPDTDVDGFLVTFEGTVVTVAGAPFGFSDSVRKTRISGSLSWNRALRDSEDDADRGIYDHASSGAFTLSVGGRVIDGSGSPQVEVENFGSDTFRFKDGTGIFGDHDRHMTIDGDEDPSIGVWIAVTDSEGTVFTDDAIPTGWPFTDIASYPHTFSVEDEGGTLLLQLDAAGPG